MYTSLLTTLAIFAASAAAKRCINQTIPLTLSARQAVFNLAVPQTNLEATDFILNMTQQGRNFSDIVLTGYNTTTGTYNISTQFCQPDSNSTASNLTSPTVQVLTHGVGFDKTYWDFSYADFNYSYINTAVDTYNYCTLSFDRLGIANSSHGEPLNEIQIFLEIAATVQLTQMLRNGTFPNITTSFQKVVHVGHSFGSAQTYSIANLYPNITDAIVLTGFSMNSSFVASFAAGGNFQQAYLNQPFRFSNTTGSQVQQFLNSYAEPFADYISPVDFSTLAPPNSYVPGYLVSSNAEANKYQFFKPGYFNQDVLEVAESTKQAVTEGELLTLGSLVRNNSFAGPVLVITGDSDLPYCGSDCLATGGASASIPARVKANFPNVNPSNFTAYIQPNTGHGINLHYNATGAYDVIAQFLNSKGLASS